MRHRSRKSCFYFCVLLCLLLTAGCSRRREKPSRAAFQGEISQRVGDMAILNLDAPAFAQLPLESRVAAYYLSEAVLAGRDIPYNQINPRSVEIRTFLEKIILNSTYATPDYYVQPCQGYLNSVWAHSGFYDLETGRKLIPLIGDRELTQLMFLAQANSGGELWSLLEVNLKRSYVVDTLFSAQLYPSLSGSPDSMNVDPLKGLPQSFYENVTAAEVQSFPQKYPRNSHLVKRGDRLVELACRTGDEEVAPGPFAPELGKVVENLERARMYLPANRVAAADLLVRYLTTGRSASFDSAAVLWRTTTAPVDFVFGFDDRRYDPLGNKGLWTALLFVADDQTQAKIEKLNVAARELLAGFPGGLKMPPAPRRIKAVQLLTAIGANGPLCPDVYHDPPDFDKEESSRQSLIFTNVIAARARAQTRAVSLEFGADAQDSALAQRYAEDLAFARVILREILDLGEEVHPLLATAPVAPDQIAALAQRELALLWLLHDSRMVELGLLSDAAALKEVDREFARQFLMDMGQPELDPLGRARRVIGNYLLAAGGGLKLEKAGHYTFCQVMDGPLLRRQIAELSRKLEELRRDHRDRVANFVFQYSASPDSVLRNEIAARLNRTGAFTEAAFILPRVEADFNPMGGVKDVRLKKPASFEQEMFLWSGYEWPVPKGKKRPKL